MRRKPAVVSHYIACSQMKTRKQPERKARQSNGGARSLAKSDQQIKQRRSKLKQQIQRSSVSASCSSSRPGLLRKNMAGIQRVCPPEEEDLMTLSNAASSEGRIHHWTQAEVVFLLQSFNDPEIKRKLMDNQRGCCRTIADSMNDRFRLESPNYVTLTGEKVRSKLKTFVAAVSDGTDSCSSLDVNLIQRYRAMLSENESTISVSKPRNRWNKISALDYMKQQGSTISELLDYSRSMADKSVEKCALTVFAILDTYEQRKGLFEELLKK